MQDVSVSRLEDLLPSPKRQGTGGQDLSHLFGPFGAPTSAPPPPAIATDSTNKKEPRNLPLPAKFNGTSTKLKEFMSKVESTYERMPQTYSTTNDKIMFIAALLTDSAYTWYSANEHKSYPDTYSDYLEWDTYIRFKREFTTAHQNLHESHDGKTQLKKEVQRKGESMKGVLQLVANLNKEQLWEHLVDSMLQEVRMHIRRVSTDKDVLDKVPPSIEMCFQTILSASSTVQFEKTWET